MALTLQQYAHYLDTRELQWPAPPAIRAARAKPHLVRLPGIRAVTWSIYGTLLAIAGGELYFEHPDQFVMDTALDKTIQEFKMWPSMSRKPGQPAEYLRQIYHNIVIGLKTMPGGGERYPEICSERIWEAFIKKLLQNEYEFDASFYGALNEFSQKVAYFFHASLQGTACYEGAADVLRHCKKGHLIQGLLADAQSFTTCQLERALLAQDSEAKLDDSIDPGLHVCSFSVRARKPSERLFRQMLDALVQRGIGPAEVLHIGSHALHDVVPARRLRMKTGLFVGDKASIHASPQLLRDPNSRPDVLLTKLAQVAEIVG
jgi:FMN phosphatase YigB (HAD superfamily)